MKEAFSQNNSYSMRMLTAMLMSRWVQWRWRSDEDLRLWLKASPMPCGLKPPWRDSIPDINELQWDPNNENQCSKPAEFSLFGGTLCFCLWTPLWLLTSVSWLCVWRCSEFWMSVSLTQIELNPSPKSSVFSTWIHGSVETCRPAGVAGTEMWSKSCRMVNKKDHAGKKRRRVRTAQEGSKKLFFMFNWLVSHSPLSNKSPQTYTHTTTHLHFHAIIHTAAAACSL